MECLFSKNATLNRSNVDFKEKYVKTVIDLYAAEHENYTMTDDMVPRSEINPIKTEMTVV